MLRYNLALALETGWQSSVEKMVYVALVSSPFIDGTLFLKGNASLESAFVMPCYVFAVESCWLSCFDILGGKKAFYACAFVVCLKFLGMVL